MLSCIRSSDKKSTTTLNDNRIDINELLSNFINDQREFNKDQREFNKKQEEFNKNFLKIQDSFSKALNRRYESKMVIDPYSDKIPEKSIVFPDPNNGEVNPENKKIEI